MKKETDNKEESICNECGKRKSPLNIIGECESCERGWNESFENR